MCLFLPLKQFATFVAPSFVEAVAGERSPAPAAKIVTLAEDLLVRLETEGVAVRLNLQGQPGEQPDFVVASWVPLRLRPARRPRLAAQPATDRVARRVSVGHPSLQTA